MPLAIDNRFIIRYDSVSIPAGPLPQGTLSHGGFFFYTGGVVCDTTSRHSLLISKPIFWFLAE
jgi:hypothetical protein